jgi:chromate transporter
VFTRLGFTAFGGPAAHVAMMEDEVVRRRGWVDHRHFLDLVAAVNFVPGPNSTELAIHLGLIRAGWPGLVVAGACFIVPAVLIILPIAWAYVTYGTGPTADPRVTSMLAAISACVVAIVAVALWRFARSGVTDRFTAAVAALALAGAVALGRYPQLQPELIALAVAAVAGAVWYGRPRTPGGPVAAAAFLPLAAVLPGWGDNVARMAAFFLKVGATLFGSGYVLVSYLETGLVDARGWMTRPQLLDAISVGQVTPGPLLTTATFVGYFLGHATFGGGVPGGIAGGALATAAIFLPSFLFIAFLGPVLQRIRHNRYARGALDAMNAAVVSLIAVVTVKLGMAALFPQGRVDVPAVVIAAATLAVLLRWNVNSTWLIAAAAAVGLAMA